MFEGEGSDGLFNNSEVCPGGGNNAAEVSTLEKEGGGSPGGTLEDRDRQTFFFRRHFSLLLLPSAFCGKTAETCHKGAGGNRKVPKCVRGGIAPGGGGTTKEPRYNAT